MKKIFKIFTFNLIIVLSISQLTGCGEKTNHVEKHKEESVAYEQPVVKEDNADVKVINYNNIKITYTVFHTEEGKEFATLVAKNSKGEKMWDYTTDTDDVMQNDNSHYLGIFNDNIYFEYLGKLIIIRTSNGEVVKELDNIHTPQEILYSDSNYIYIGVHKIFPVPTFSLSNIVIMDKNNNIIKNVNINEGIDISSYDIKEGTIKIDYYGEDINISAAEEKGPSKTKTIKITDLLNKDFDVKKLFK